MKKIILGIIIAFTLIITIQGVHAVDPNDFDGFFATDEVKDVYASNRPINMSINYLETYLSYDVSAYSSYDFAIFDLSALLTVQNLVINSVNDGGILRGTHLRLLNASNVELTKVYDIFNSNYLAQYTIPSSVSKIEVVATYILDNPSMTEYQRLQQQSRVSGLLNQRALSGSSFMRLYREGVLMDSEQFFEYLNTFIDDYKDNQQPIYDQYYIDGLEQGKTFYGIYHNDELLTAEQWGNIRYQAGLTANQSNTALGTMFSGLASLFGVGLAFILQLGSIELMGISLNMILGIGLLLVGLIAILGLIFGGK